MTDLSVLECTCPVSCLLSAVLGVSHPLAVDGDRAVIGDGDSLVVLDLTHVYSPVVASRHELAGWIDGVELWKRRAYVSGEGFDDVVDVRIPPSPATSGVHDVRDWVVGVEWAGDRSYRTELGFLHEVEIVTSTP